MSVNVGPNDGGHQVCELNSATDESPKLSGLFNRKGYTYHGIEVLVYNYSNNTKTYLDASCFYCISLFIDKAMMFLNSAFGPLFLGFLLTCETASAYAN